MTAGHILQRYRARDTADRVEIQQLVNETGMMMAQTYWWRRSHLIAADPHSGGR